MPLKLERERRQAMARRVVADRHKRRTEVVLIIFLIFLVRASSAATVFSTSLESCKEQCVDRNIAIPLARGGISWPNTTLADCDFDCHVESCRVGCQDLESSNSTCDTRCDTSAVKRPDSCRQGCRAVADIFLHQIQYLLNRVSVEILHDTLQGIRLNWTFEDIYALTLQEISAANIRWVAQTRVAGGCATAICAGELCSWKWTILDGKAFKDSKMQFTVAVPFENCSEIQVRLAAVWRDMVVVSEAVAQPLPLSDAAVQDGGSMPAKLRILPHSRLQLTADSYLLCWHSESRQREFAAVAGELPPPRFRLRVFPRTALNESLDESDAVETATVHTDEGGVDEGVRSVKLSARHALRTKLTSASCHLFRGLKCENGCLIEIAELAQRDGVSVSSEDDEENEDPGESAPRHVSKSTLSAVVVDVQLQHVPGGEESDAYVIFTDGRSLYVIDDMNDYVMADEPSTIPFEIAEDLTVTALASLSTKRLLVGLSDGSIFALDTSGVKGHRQKRSTDDGETKTTASTELTTTTTMSGSGGGIFALFEGVGNKEDTEKGKQHDDVTTKSSDTPIPKPATVERPKATRIRSPDGVAVVQIAVDALQIRLYIVRERAGLTRCVNFDDCDSNTTTLSTTTNLQNSIQNIAVDSWNGFLYYSTANGDVFATPLFPADAIGAYSLTITRRLADLPSVFALNVDLQAQKLIAILRNGSLWSRDLVDERLLDERASYSLIDGYKAVTRTQYLHNRLFWISKNCGDAHPWETCLYSEEFDHKRKNVHLNRYLYGGRVQEFVIMQEAQRPAFLQSPARIGLIVDSTEARLNWKPPKPLPFQASGSSWRSYLYSYSFALATNDAMASNSSLAAGRTNTTDVFVALTRPDDLSKLTDPSATSSAPKGTKPRDYVASVRACSRDGAVCSAPVQTRNRGLRSDTSNRRNILVVAGKPSSSADSTSRFTALNLVGRDLGAEKLSLTSLALAQIPMNDVASLTLAYDNSTGVVYSSTRSDISIFRVLESGIRYRFLDFIAVRFVSVVAGKALIFVASSYTIAAYRLTSSYDRTIYNCASDECGEVVGMAADGHSGDVRVFFFLRRRSGDIELHKHVLGAEKVTSEKVASIRDFYALRQTVVIDDRIVFLTSDGQIGIFDVSSLTWNFNLALRDVQFILSGDWANANNRLQFKSVEYDSTHGELKWNIDDHTAQAANGGTTMRIPGHLLYKVSSTCAVQVELYRDNFGGDRIVSLTQHNRFVIPRTVLNNWRSSQVFDVQVDAISAWTVASANRTGLLAPSKPPSAPKRLNVYATQQKTVDGTRANIDVLWDEPAEWNGEMLGYLVNCTWDNGTQLVNTRVSARRSRAYSFVVKSGRLLCAVAAINEQGLVGALSEPAIIDGSDFRPLIRLFAIDSTDLLVAIQNWTTPSLDSSKSFVPFNGAGSGGGSNDESSSGSAGNGGVDIRSRFSRTRRQTPNTAQYQTVAFIGNELYAVRKEADALFLVLLDINDISNVLYKGSLIGDFGGQIEAMTSDWVGNRLLLVSNHDFLQISLDALQQTSTITPRRLFSLSSGAQEAKQLIFDPFTNVAYLLTKNGSLFSLNLNRNGSESNLALELDCLRSQTVTSIVAQFTWNRAISPYIFALTWNGMISINTAMLKPNDGGNGASGTGGAAGTTTTASASNEGTAGGTQSFGQSSSDTFDGGKKCADVSVNWDTFGEKGLKAISSFTVADKLFIFFTSNELLIYDRQSAIVSPVPIANPPLRQILVVSQSSQPFPDRSCFALPSAARLNFTVRGAGRTGAIVEIDEPPTLYASCAPISSPQTQYQVQFWRRGTDKVKIKNSYARIIHLENGLLDKETDYDIVVLWYNRYTPQQNSVNGVFTPPADVMRVAFRTGYGYPTAPNDPSACALTPDSVLLYWKMPHTLNAPPNEIKYKVTQLSSALVSPVPIGVKQLEAEGTNGVGDIYSPTISDIVSCVRNSCRALVPNLRPSVDYQFWITALHVNRLNSQLADDPDAVSTEAATRTKDIPGILRVEETFSDSLLLRWNWLSPQSAPAKITVQYRQSGNDVLWLELRNSSFDPTSSASAVRNITIGELQSATTYDFRFVAEYIGEYTYDNVNYAFDEFFYQQAQQTRTKAGTPSAPTDVRIVQNPDGWILQWSPPKSNGGEPILTYAVEFRPNKDADWEIAERGIPASRLYWRIGQPWRDSSGVKSDVGTSDSAPTTSATSDADLFSSAIDSDGIVKPLRLTTTTSASSILASDGDDVRAASKDSSEGSDTDANDVERRFGETVAYRVRAANSEGFGAYASTIDDNGESNAMGADGTSANDATPMGVLGSSWRYFFSVFILALLLVAVVIFSFARQRKLVLKHKKDKVNRIINLETIASQIQYPCSPTHFPPEVENELRNLPFVSQFAVERRSLLGRGSFGEVWEGLLTDVDAPVDSPKLRVAIKYLKHCNDDENRLKFLREAILMNNFDHPNIVKLLGVQRQIEPHFLVIELMEGGDLHSFLNSSRPHDGQPSQLCLKELISIMIDIGRGGAYLETFKHVHRDLAARNCLISSKYSTQRVTKIADFGLARDIFAQDYYRIHGSDFLPLRWLSPESAIHGIFTTKSDVWAFGIVLWEIMTLGQQPYPGITNVEVLSSLHEGRPPKRPNECPDEIFAIMKLAWTFDAEKRPTFVELLSRLESLRGKPHLQLTDPFPSSPTAFDSSHGSSSANQQSSTTTSCCSARISNGAPTAGNEYFGGIADCEQMPSGGGGGSTSQTSLNQLGTPKHGNRLDKSDYRQNQRGFKNYSHGSAAGFMSLERPESTLSGNTMSTTLDNEYEKPIRSGGSGAPFFHLTRGSLNTTAKLPHQHSSESYANAAFVDDGPTTGTRYTMARPASLLLTSGQVGEFFNTSTPPTPKSANMAPPSQDMAQHGRFNRAFVSTPQIEVRRSSYQSSPYLQKATRNVSNARKMTKLNNNNNNSGNNNNNEDTTSTSSSPYATVHAMSNTAINSPKGIQRDRLRSFDAPFDLAKAQAASHASAHMDPSGGESTSKIIRNFPLIAPAQPTDNASGNSALHSSRKNDVTWGSGRISHV